MSGRVGDLSPKQHEILTQVKKENKHFIQYICFGFIKGIYLVGNVGEWPYLCTCACCYGNTWLVTSSVLCDFSDVYRKKHLTLLEHIYKECVICIIIYIYFFLFVLNHMWEILTLDCIEKVSLSVNKISFG